MRGIGLFKTILYVYIINRDKIVQEKSVEDQKCTKTVLYLVCKLHKI